MSVRTRDLLRRLVRRPEMTVGVVTGRSQSDITRRVHVRGLVIAASHGLQISFAGVHWVHPAAKRSVPVIAELTRELRQNIGSVRNVLIENKKLTLAVHYRNVREKDVASLLNQVSRICESYKSELRLTEGKKVLEMKPRADWNKGRAVLRILKSVGHTGSQCVVYIGDDETDEDAFKVLRSRAVTIRVGRVPASAAAYWVPGPSHVRMFLEAVDSMNRGADGR